MVEHHFNDVKPNDVVVLVYLKSNVASKRNIVKPDVYELVHNEVAMRSAFSPM